MREIRIWISIVACICLSLRGFAGDTTKINTQTPAPDKSTAEIKLPSGFQAVAVVDSLGRTRHLVVHQNGDVYVKLERLKDGKGISG